MSTDTTKPTTPPAAPRGIYHGFEPPTDPGLETVNQFSRRHGAIDFNWKYYDLRAKDASEEDQKAAEAAGEILVKQMHVTVPDEARWLYESRGEVFILANGRGEVLVVARHLSVQARKEEVRSQKEEKPAERGGVDRGAGGEPTAPAEPVAGSRQ
jgi:hypothetical protein